MEKDLYVNENDELELALLPVFLNKIIKKLHKVSDKILKQYNLSRFHYIYLLCLFKNSEGLKLTELTDLSGFDRANTTRVINDLENKGLIVRDKQTDKKYKVKLTEKGFAITNSLYEKTLKLKDRFFGGLTEAQIHRFLVLTRKIFKGI